jgi:hypothetical protein
LRKRHIILVKSVSPVISIFTEVCSYSKTLYSLRISDLFDISHTDIFEKRVGRVRLFYQIINIMVLTGLNSVIDKTQ